MYIKCQFKLPTAYWTLCFEFLLVIFKYNKNLKLFIVPNNFTNFTREF